MNLNLFRLMMGLGLALVLTSCQTAGLSRIEAKSPPKRLVLALDGVSFQLIEKMYEGGHLRQFQRPTPMIATFPSISDPNWNRLMATETAPGYTKAHFFPDFKKGSRRGEIRGNLLDHLTQDMNYERSFDFRAQGFIEHFASVTWIETTALYWLDAIERDLFQTRGHHTFFAFVVNTDLLSHTSGEKALMKFIAALDLKVLKLREKFQKKYSEDLEVVIVSDHGNSYYRPIEMVGAESALKKLGWRPSDSLGSPKDFVFVAPEILSFGAFYCDPKDARQLALELARLKGVHVASYLGGPNQVNIFSNGGKSQAVVTVMPAERRLGYKVLTGRDPFEDHVALFESAGTSEKTLSFDDYLEKTDGSLYPYAGVRLWEGFYLNARYPGQVLVSTKLGFAFENPTLKILTDIRGLESMHGSLHRDETIGVVISTHSKNQVMRPDDFAREFVLPYRKASQLALVRLN